MFNLEEIKLKLNKEQQEIKETLEEIQLEFEEVVSERTGATDELADQYEVKSETSLQKKILSNRLKQISRALKKIEEGTYGKCDNCHLDIEASRLNIDYAVNVCRKCSRG
ncbi:MAG: hypothetical protein KatS3mg097_408 [Candidatus Parcubacteria bacterium]|nr:MAG: hypothetical protein KatS3mg097_408 [Candidatus Parcubacteria bacterium]